MKNHWMLILTFLKNRIVNPWSNPSYVMYFIIIIIFVNSIGIIKDLTGYKLCWDCQFDSKKVTSFTFNLTNIGLSLVTASVIDLMFISRKSIKVETELQNYNSPQLESIKKSIRIFGLSSLIIIFIVWILVNSFIEHSFLKIFFSTLALLFSFLVWWISNVRNKILSTKKETVPLAPIGGSVNSDQTTDTDGNLIKDENPDIDGNLSNFKID